jgi:hypothetical protein
VAESKVLSWLLETSQPSVQYRTLTGLLGRSVNDPEVREAKGNLRRTGWAADILAERHPGGGWEDGTSQYQPKYISTHWKMLVLADLGLTRTDPAVHAACEFWMRGFAAKGGGLGGNSSGTPHYCIAANMARASIQFGYVEDPRVRRTLEWLVETADPKGGWSCYGTGRNLDSWEALSAFAVYPRAKWSAAMAACVAKGAEFFLERELCRQGARYAPWFRFHYPAHYYYDILVGLDFMTALGYGRDPRLSRALAVLRKKRRSDGRWNLDALHPDVTGNRAEFFRRHPKERPIPWGLEVPGKPSKMITLTALRVLARAEQNGSAQG